MRIIASEDFAPPMSTTALAMATHAPNCASCASAQSRIAELEAQVTQLNEKAADAVARWAEYEAELHKMRVANRPPTPEQTPSRTMFQQIMAARKPAPLRQNSLPTQLAPADELLEALTREQTLRREAEGRLTATSREVEELSASLFEQANEMVADERRARAKLEERVGELERRDAEKRRRLERLEVAMGRIERVRTLLEES